MLLRIGRASSSSLESRRMVVYAGALSAVTAIWAAVRILVKNTQIGGKVDDGSTLPSF
jgi:hypothetical protein